MHAESRRRYFARYSERNTQNNIDYTLVPEKLIPGESARANDAESLEGASVFANYLIKEI